MTAKPFVLLDRDGTLIKERHYLSDPQQVTLYPETTAGLRQLQAAGFGLVVITNQSGLGRGYFSAARLAEIHRTLLNLLGIEGIEIDGIYYCPHTPEDGCGCRKPEPGLVQQAAADLGFDPANSVVIGDKPCDIELGRRVGAKTILVRTGYGAEFASGNIVHADLVADNIREAARMILDPFL